jgi:hypothetical protein
VLATPTVEAVAGVFVPLPPDTPGVPGPPKPKGEPPAPLPPPPPPPAYTTDEPVIEFAVPLPPLEAGLLLPTPPAPPPPPLLYGAPFVPEPPAFPCPGVPGAPAL